MTRREVLAGAAAGVVGATATACAIGPAVPDPDRGPWQVTPDARLSDIDHVVILMQENRSFDHYFGTRPGVRGFADPTVARRADGRPIWYQDTLFHPDGYLLP